MSWIIDHGGTGCTLQIWLHYAGLHYVRLITTVPSGLKRHSFSSKSQRSLPFTYRQTVFSIYVTRSPSRKDPQKEERG